MGLVTGAIASLWTGVGYEEVLANRGPIPAAGTIKPTGKELPPGSKVAFKTELSARSLIGREVATSCDRVLTSGVSSYALNSVAKEEYRLIRRIRGLFPLECCLGVIGFLLRLEGHSSAGQFQGLGCNRAVLGLKIRSGPFNWVGLFAAPLNDRTML